MREGLAKGLTRAVLHFMVLLHIGFSISEPQPHHVLDLLQSLNQTDSRAAGFQYITGPDPNSPAILLQASSRNVSVPEATALAAQRMWESSDDVTFLATVRQDLGDSGSIISFSSSLYRYVELESSGRRDEIRFHYTHQQQAHVETFPYRLADGRWHHLALTLSGTCLTLWVNCRQEYSRVLRQSVDRTFRDHSASGSGHPLRVFIGQRNDQHALFRGALQDVKIVTQAHGYLLQCPHQNADCPTFSQHQALENQVQQMYRLYRNISEKNGTVECRSVECPPADCKNPVYRDGECCPVCLSICYYSGKYYDHGETISPRVCVTCTCDNGQMVCERQDPSTSCPPLTCPRSQRIQVQGQCCPVCKGTDFCSAGHDCHQNASCVNLATQYACQCNPGFQGDGKHCQDIDECGTEGGKYGHHCHTHTVCVNTPGSYRCQCRQGYHRLDDYTCQEAQPDPHHSSSASATATTVFHPLILTAVLGWRLSLVLSGHCWGGIS